MDGVDGLVNESKCVQHELFHIWCRLKRRLNLKPFPSFLNVQ